MDKYTVRDNAGSVDVSASANAYAKALTEWASSNEIPAGQIATAVNAVLAGRAGKNTPMPSLCSLAAHELDATAETFKGISERVHAYVRGQVVAGNLFVQKGAGGGVSNVAPAQKSA